MADNKDKGKSQEPPPWRSKLDVDSDPALVCHLLRRFRSRQNARASGSGSTNVAELPVEAEEENPVEADPAVEFPAEDGDDAVNLGTGYNAARTGGEIC